MSRRPGIDEEFHRRESRELHIVGEPHRSIAQLLAQIGIECRGRGISTIF